LRLPKLLGKRDPITTCFYQSSIPRKKVKYALHFRAGGLKSKGPFTIWIDMKMVVSAAAVANVAPLASIHQLQSFRLWGQLLPEAGAQNVDYSGQRE